MDPRGARGSDGVEPWSRRPRPTRAGTTCQWSHQTDRLDAPRPKPVLLTRPPPSGGRLLPNDGSNLSRKSEAQQRTQVDRHTIRLGRVRQSAARREEQLHARVEDI